MGTRKVVINTCYGGFGLSLTAEKELAECNYDSRRIERDNPKLVEIVERMGEDANGTYADLRVVEIPDDVEWIIEEYDGKEWIAEKHRTWQ